MSTRLSRRVDLPDFDMPILATEMPARRKHCERSQFDVLVRNVLMPRPGLTQAELEVSPARYP
ncbi:hypothetical protein [Archangium sp.]|uniref:hypothetical protein n=1 Tax=Archangium sp. TaxID=1872627 RepID=UPI002D28B20E|nr:hypothetical protein [Archangium sp.]HYO56720.1 hypothetical protein [Archangium sp.]